MIQHKKKIVIWWAGPAWLTLAYEILSRSDKFEVIVLERFDRVGGISATIDHHGNKMDIGGHRFFSKSKRVMDRRFDKMPLQWSLPSDYKQAWIISKTESNGPDPDKEEDVMLARRRLSRIFWNNKFFDYPLNISWPTIKTLGLIDTIKIWLSYISSKFRKYDTTNLEWFYKSRFGEVLYNRFFKNYTYNVWWVEPKDISSERWAQRVKGLSLFGAIWDYFKKIFVNKQTTDTETSLIWSFYYPKYGPWHMWQVVADKVVWLGGDIIYGADIIKTSLSRDRIDNIVYKKDKEKHTLECDYFASTIAIKDLLGSMQWADHDIVNLSQKLLYRDFISVWLLLDKLSIKSDGRFPSIENILPDNWIYVHDDRVKVGRIQIFNNRSPYLIKSTWDIWIWLEYFCNTTDHIRNLDEQQLLDLVVGEVKLIWLIDNNTTILDHHIVKYEKTYPSYFGEWYEKFDDIKNYLDNISNLFVIWRNGMHRYNNQDHSMLCSMHLADMLIDEKIDKSILRDINTERVYHEQSSK